MMSRRWSASWALQGRHHGLVVGRRGRAAGRDPAPRGRPEAGGHSVSMRAEGDFPEVREQFGPCRKRRLSLPRTGAIAARHALSRCRLGVGVPQDWRDAPRHYDWSADVAQITAPTLLIFADADMMYLEHMVEFYRLLGGGTRDAGIDGSLRPTPNQLAIIPGTTHYNLVSKETKTSRLAKAFLAG